MQTDNPQHETLAPTGLRQARLAFAISYLLAFKRARSARSERCVLECIGVSAGKLAGASGRFFRIGGGTNLPSMIARRIAPDVLKPAVGMSRAKKIIIKGVGLLDLYTEGGGTRFMTHMALDCEFPETGKKILVGYENHSGRTCLGSKAQPQGKVLAE